MMNRILLTLAALLIALPAAAQNAPSGSPRVQGVPDGYGDPVQVTVVSSNGSNPTGTSAEQVQGTAATATAAVGNPVQVGGIMDNTPAAVGAAGTVNTLKVDSRGYLWTNIGIGGTSVVTASGISSVSRGVTTGALSSGRVVTGTTGVIKASAGTLYSLLSVRNGNAAVRYLHLYNKATAPTLSTDTPILTIALAASSVQNAIDMTSIGAAFPLGIAWAYTTDNIAIPATAGTSTELMFSAVYQ